MNQFARVVKFGPGDSHDEAFESFSRQRDAFLQLAEERASEISTRDILDRVTDGDHLPQLLALVSAIDKAVATGDVADLKMRLGYIREDLGEEDAAAEIEQSAA